MLKIVVEGHTLPQIDSVTHFWSVLVVFGNARWGRSIFLQQLGNDNLNMRMRHRQKPEIIQNKIINGESCKNNIIIHGVLSNSTL